MDGDGRFDSACFKFTAKYFASAADASKLCSVFSLKYYGCVFYGVLCLLGLAGRSAII
jgi:hypothetical protein